jgi:ribonuclease HI
MPVFDISDPMKRSGTKVQLTAESGGQKRPGWWRFRMSDPEMAEPLEIDDIEPNTQGERLELLCVLRALEALEGPRQVTLFTASNYVREGIRYGLEDWRRDDWQWESFGEMVPVRNDDLWRRIDRTLKFHEVHCRPLRELELCESGLPESVSVLEDENEISPTTDWTADRTVERALVGQPVDSQADRSFEEPAVEQHRPSCEKRASIETTPALGKMKSLFSGVWERLKRSWRLSFDEMATAIRV